MKECPAFRRRWHQSPHRQTEILGNSFPLETLHRCSLKDVRSFERGAAEQNLFIQPCGEEEKKKEDKEDHNNELGLSCLHRTPAPSRLSEGLTLPHGVVCAKSRVACHRGVAFGFVPKIRIVPEVCRVPGVRGFFPSCTRCTEAKQKAEEGGILFHFEL